MAEIRDILINGIVKYSTWRINRFNRYLISSNDLDQANIFPYTKTDINSNDEAPFQT